MEVDSTIATAGMPGRRPKVVDRFVRDDCDEADGVVDDHLDLSHQAVRLHLGHDCPEAITSADLTGAWVALAPQSVDLRRWNEPPVAVVAKRRDATLAVPAADRVDADAQHPRCGTDVVGVTRHRAPVRR